jgi:glycosyltransferase involved in cell wall biosynthesis
MYWRTLLRYPERILAQTRQQQQSLEENRGIQSQYVGNGHPVPDGTIEKGTPPVVLWLASLKAWKQPENFLTLARECRDLDCRFWLVGRPADADVHQRVTEATSELENTTYKGGCSFEESNDFFERASLFVNTSIAGAEGFPNTFVQAWLRKTPVVSLHKDVDGALAEHGVGALAADEQQFVEIVRDLMPNSEKRIGMGERAQEFATERYSISVVVDRLKKAIQ